MEVSKSYLNSVSQTLVEHHQHQVALLTINLADISHIKYRSQGMKIILVTEVILKTFTHFFWTCIKPFK